MKKMTPQKLAPLACAVLILVAGCVTPVGGEVEVSGPPPAAYVETAPACPGPGYVWIGGAWAWQGNRWDWDKGRWAQPPHPGAVWVPHHYAEHNGKRTFTQGRWQDHK